LAHILYDALSADFEDMQSIPAFSRWLPPTEHRGLIANFLVPGLPWISDYDNDYDHCCAFDSDIAMITARRSEAKPR
jgi:hypothetical protein